MEIFRGSIHPAVTVHSSGSGGGIFGFVVALAVFAGMSVLGIKRSKKHQAELVRFAASAGWQYIARDDQRTFQWQRPPFNQGYDHRATNVVLGAFAGRQIEAFDYSYKEQTTDGKGNTSSTTYRFAVCALELPADLPYLDVGPESVLSRLENVVGVHDIEIESEDFNRKFRVHANDPKFASDVLSPRLAQTLLSLPPYHWRTDGATLVSWSTGVLQPSAFQQWFSALSGVIDSIPDFVWHDRGVSIPAAAPSPNLAPDQAAAPTPVQPALPTQTILPGQNILPGKAF